MLNSLQSHDEDHLIFENEGDSTRLPLKVS